MDDPAVVACAFCGCRKCFGKHDSEYLLLCDHCDQEAHTYCLDPQLHEVPTDAWFCGFCVAAGHNVPSTDAGEDTAMAVVEGEDVSEGPLRFKGRPGRPRKGGHRASAAAAAAAAASASAAALAVADVAAHPSVNSSQATLNLMKVSRGRGRPPGPSKHAAQSAATGLGSYGAVGHGGGSGLSGPRLLDPGSMPAPDATHPSQGVDGAADGDAAAIETEGAGVAAALTILEKVNGARPFYPAECAVLAQMREWSPLEDLEVVHAALVAQKAALLEK
jgi:hypothetical protein